MGNFCKYCGKPLTDGKCTCDQFIQAEGSASTVAGTGSTQDNGIPNGFAGAAPVPPVDRSVVTGNLGTDFINLFIRSITDPFDTASTVPENNLKAAGIIKDIFAAVIILLVWIATKPNSIVSGLTSMDKDAQLGLLIGRIFAAVMTGLLFIFYYWCFSQIVYLIGGNKTINRKLFMGRINTCMGLPMVLAVLAFVGSVFSPTLLNLFLTLMFVTLNALTILTTYYTMTVDGKLDRDKAGLKTMLSCVITSVVFVLVIVLVVMLLTSGIRD